MVSARGHSDPHGTMANIWGQFWLKQGREWYWHLVGRGGIHDLWVLGVRRDREGVGGKGEGRRKRKHQRLPLPQRGQVSLRARLASCPHGVPSFPCLDLGQQRSAVRAGGRRGAWARGASHPGVRTQCPLVGWAPDGLRVDAQGARGTAVSQVLAQALAWGLPAWLTPDGPAVPQTRPSSGPRPWAAEHVWKVGASAQIRRGRGQTGRVEDVDGQPHTQG